MLSKNIITRRFVLKTKPKSLNLWRISRRYRKKSTKRMTNNVNYLKKKSDYKKTCCSKTHKNFSNCEKKKQTCTEKSNQQWQRLGTFNRTSGSWIKNSNVNKNYYTTQNIRSSWWKEKSQGLGAKRLSRRKKIWRRKLMLFRLNTISAAKTTSCLQAVWRSWRRTSGLSKKLRTMSSCRKTSTKRSLKHSFWKTTWPMSTCKESPNKRKKFWSDTTVWNWKFRKLTKFCNKP